MGTDSRVGAMPRVRRSADLIPKSLRPAPTFLTSSATWQPHTGGVRFWRCILPQAFFTSHTQRDVTQNEFEEGSSSTLAGLHSIGEKFTDV